MRHSALTKSLLVSLGVLAANAWATSAGAQDWPQWRGPGRDNKVAGFTAPNTPVGSRGASDPDNPGWAGLGFAVEWGRSGRPGSRAD